MDWTRGAMERQKSSLDSPGAAGPPMMSPLNRHVRSSSSGLANMRKPQNMQAKAAAQRLAQVMAHQPTTDDEDDEDDDFSLEYGSTGLGLAATGRSIRPQTPTSVHPAVEQPSPARPSVTGRPSLSVRMSERTSVVGRPSQPASTASEQPSSALYPSPARSPLSLSQAEQPISMRTNMTVNKPEHLLPSRSTLSISQPEQPTSGRSTMSINHSEQHLSGRSPLSFQDQDQLLSGRSVLPSSSTEQPPSARSSVGVRPNLGTKAVPIVPPAVTISLKPQTPKNPEGAQGEIRRDKRLSMDWGSMNVRETKEPQTQLSSTALQDELRLAEERCEEAEARAKQLERQAALRVAAQTTQASQIGELAVLRMEAETARDEATSALGLLQESETEIRSLRSAVQRLKLTQEEMVYKQFISFIWQFFNYWHPLMSFMASLQEEVVLKRCWLARYWGLCVKFGLHPDIAEAKYEFWSSFAPLPVEVVLAAGQKAKDDNQPVPNDVEERGKFLQDINELYGEGTTETMLLVDKGLRELAVLKVEDAVFVALAQQRRRNLKCTVAGTLNVSLTFPVFVVIEFVDDLRSPLDIHKYVEAFDLSEEEAEEVRFKQAWLTYFWRRVKNHELETDIVEERLQYWIDQGTRIPTSHDAVDAERGLMELRKLGMETRLWEGSRKWLEHESHAKNQSDIDF
ncbi:Coiled-coil domain-containing protein [Drosera capensis]